MISMKDAMMKAIQNRQKRSPSSEEIDLYASNPIDVSHGASLDQSLEDPEYELSDEEEELKRQKAMEANDLLETEDKTPRFGDLRFQEYLDRKKNK
jgi:hypothetical protein